MVSTFDKDIVRGVACEEYVLKLLKNEYPDIERVEGYNPDYDLLSEYYSAEVKFDELSSQTDNIGIEIRYKGIPSCLSVTKADEWFHIYFDKYWGYSRIPVNLLRSFVKSNRKFFKIVRGGDNSLSSLILIPKQIVITNFGFIKIT